MKILFSRALSAAALIFLFSACGKDQDPHIHNEEELITSFILTLIPEAGGETVEMSFRDTDGEGGNPPVLTGGNLLAGKVYRAEARFLNESTQPVTDITSEIRNEAEEHQIFYIPSVGLGLSVAYSDSDSGGKPLGISTKISTSAVSEGSISIRLIHMPNKAATGAAEGDPGQAGGTTDMEITLPVRIR